jgi:N-acetylglucosamine malate deacetylase 1
MADRVVLAVAAHPDDIEFSMAGTLLRLRDAGWQLHCMNIGNGSCGSAVEDPETIIATRTLEAQDAARLLGATWHPPICNDLEIAYTNDQIGKVCSLIRLVKPRIVLAHSPRDYMEDHTIACRIAVTAAFCRGIRNYRVEPDMPPVGDDVTIYHGMPHGLRGPLRERIIAGQYVDTGPCLAEKRQILACHRSQREWLDATQGIGNYLTTMEELSSDVGRQSGVFRHAEGWRRHSHLGFSATDGDPLSEALGPACRVNDEYERRLDEGR